MALPDQPVQPLTAAQQAALDGLPDRVRLTIDFAPAVAAQALAEVAGQSGGATHAGSALWTPHFVPAHYAGDWSALPLRAPEGALHPILQISANPGTKAWVATEHLRASPILQAMLAQFRCPLQGARLMRLAAGSSIHRHRDDDLNAGWGQARLHVPLATHEAVDFRLNDEPVPMRVGECWYLRLSDPHEVHNPGPEDRIHLVIDVVVNDWLADQLIGAASAPDRATTASAAAPRAHG